MGDDLLQSHTGSERETILRDDGPFVEVHGDEVGGDSNYFDALLVGLAIGLRSRKTWQQRGVNVDDLVFETPDEVGGENFHETGKDHKINLVLLERAQSLLLPLCAVFPRNQHERQLRLPG